MNALFAESLGWAGAILVLTAYFLVSTEKVSGSSNLFQYMNIGGAGCLIVYTYHCQAYASFAVNSIWVLIGLRSMYNISKTKRTLREIPSSVAGPAPVAIEPQE